MYTFYFQALEKLGQWKLIAYRGPENFDDINLGQTYNDFDLVDLMDMGYRIVRYPIFENDSGQPTRMFYAKGYRGPSYEYSYSFVNSKGEIVSSAQSANMANVETCPVTDLPMSECKDRFPSFHRPEDEQDFIDYANGSQPNWCGEDLGQDPLNADSLERESYIRGDSQPLIAEVAQSAKPAIGPLPPQAPLAPIPPPSESWNTWNTETKAYHGGGVFHFLESWRPEHGTIQTKEAPIPPEGSMLIPSYKMEYVEVPAFVDQIPEITRKLKKIVDESTPEEPSWWDLFKNWIKKDF